MIDLPIMCFYGTFDEFRIGGVVAVKGGGGGRSSNEDVNASEYVNGGALCSDATNGSNYTSSSFALVSRYIFGWWIKELHVLAQS